MIQPRLAEGAELVLEPTREHVDCSSAARININGRKHLRDHCGMPEPGMNCADELELSGLRRQHGGAGYRLLLQLPAMTGEEARRRKAVFETKPFGGLSKLGVIIETPIRALLDIADDKTAAAE